MKQTLILVAFALLAGAASLIAGGPLPGDISITRALQSLLGAEPAWADFVTRTAKTPLLWCTLVLGGTLTASVAGWRGALGVPLAYALAWLVDKALRAAIFVPKPGPELVAVASASTASGLPSTFGLVYGSLFGAVFWLRREGETAAVQRVLALLLMLCGSTARVILGGHWTSQMIASVCVGILAAGISTWVVKQCLPRSKRGPGKL